MAPARKSGGRKDDAGGKLKFELLPARPLQLVAEVFTIGSKKYGDRNWEQGIAYGRLFGAMMRHAWAWWRGERNDPEDGQHHLSSVAFCALALMELEETRPEYDDRPGVVRAAIDVVAAVVADPATAKEALLRAARPQRAPRRRRASRARRR